MRQAMRAFVNALGALRALDYGKHYRLLGGGRGPIFRFGAASAIAAVLLPLLLSADGHRAGEALVDVAAACICCSQACCCW